MKRLRDPSSLRKYNRITPVTSILINESRTIFIDSKNVSNSEVQYYLNKSHCNKEVNAGGFGTYYTYVCSVRN